MSKISYITRPANANGEHPISIKHVHGIGTPFTKATGVVVPKQYINLKTGVVSKLFTAPDQNAQIQAVRNDIDRALTNLRVRELEPSKAALSAEYDNVMREREQLERIQPKLRLIQSVTLEDLQAELTELEQQVKTKKIEIQRYLISIGQLDSQLLTTYFKRYCEDMKDDLSSGSIGMFHTVRQRIEAFNPLLEMKDLNEESLAALETWLRSRYALNTVRDTISKTKTVWYQYCKGLGLNKLDVSEFKQKLKRKKNNSNVDFITEDEILDFMALDFTDNILRARVRDQFIFMCLTGLRYSDSMILPIHVKQDASEDYYLDLSTLKTDNDLIIPLSPLAMEILDRNGRTFPRDYLTSSFSKMLKKIAKLVPALNREIEIKKYMGSNKPTKSVIKRSAKIATHTGRKSLINNSLIRGINPVTVASIVGHEGVELILKTYGSDKAGKNRIREIGS